MTWGEFKAIVAKSDATDETPFVLVDPNFGHSEQIERYEVEASTIRVGIHYPLCEAMD